MYHVRKLIWSNSLQPLFKIEGHLAEMNGDERGWGGGDIETRFNNSKLVLCLIKISKNRRDYFRRGKETCGKMYGSVQMSSKIECTSCVNT